MMAAQFFEVVKVNKFGMKQPRVVMVQSGDDAQVKIMATGGKVGCVVPPACVSLLLEPCASRLLLASSGRALPLIRVHVCLCMVATLLRSSAPSRRRRYSPWRW